MFHTATAKRYLYRFLMIFVLASALPASAHTEEHPNTYAVHYSFDLSQNNKQAQVRIAIPDAHLLKTLDFNINGKRQHNIKANGKLILKNGRAKWQPPSKNAWLSLTVDINHKRANGSFDALRTDDFAIFRGDDLVPPARVIAKRGARSRATLTVKLPKGWHSVNSGWVKTHDGHFIINNPARHFDRPTGWLIAGHLGTRRENLQGTHIAISAPKGNKVKRLEVLSFVVFNWPTLKKIVGKTPIKILIISAGDPLWHGGLSGPNSLFLHASRPLVSENGTSPLIHELIHTLTGISGDKKDDWIAEGLAEYYSFAVLHRAGAMTDKRFAHVKHWLANWSKEVKHLRGPHSTGETTARAALLFDQLDSEIRAQTHGKKSLDNATRAMMKRGKISLQDLRDICKNLTGSNSKVLASDLLKD